MKRKGFIQSISRVSFIIIFSLITNLTLKGQNFITNWYFSSATKTIEFQAETLQKVKYGWSASPSGKSGSGVFDMPTAGLITLIVDVDAGDNVTLEISDDGLNRFFFDAKGDALNLREVYQWGAVAWTSMSGAFSGCENMFAISTIDIPNLTKVSDMNNMFRICKSLEKANTISEWDVSNVGLMNGMFYQAGLLNEDLSPWNVSNVIDMGSMFQEANSFNSKIGNWSTKNVLDMSNMLYSAKSFNQNLDSWVLNSEVNLEGMLSLSRLDCDNYSSTLIGWAGLGIKSRILGADNLQYGKNAMDSRDKLTNDQEWKIIGDSESGTNCPALALLPVTLFRFEVRSKGNVTILDWVTATESNNKKFIIEHSLDGLKFEAIGEVNGSGTKAEASTYQYLHANPAPGINYYRLKQVDFDGKYYTSKMQSLSFALDKISLYPNPAFLEMYVITPIDVEANIYDIAGRRLSSVKLKTGSNKLHLDAFKSGMYFLLLTNGAAYKFIKE